MMPIDYIGPTLDGRVPSHDEVSRRLAEIRQLWRCPLHTRETLLPLLREFVRLGGNEEDAEARLKEVG
jgi:hypothetical protein